LAIVKIDNPERHHVAHEGDGHDPGHGAAFDRFLVFLAHGAAPESNRPSVGLPRLTDFEDRLGHRAHAAPKPA
jgi:hypothetical protein